jgi:hypothetical protein
MVFLLPAFLSSCIPVLSGWFACVTTGSNPSNQTKQECRKIGIQEEEEEARPTASRP